MKNYFTSIAFLICIFYILPAYSQDLLDKYPKPTASVADFEDIFTPQEEAILNSYITVYNKRADAQIVIVTIDYNSTTAEKFEALTFQIAKSWQLGSSDKNNGILIGISGGLRMIEIQNGKGIEVRMTNTETKKIIDSVFIPSFKKGKYFKGARDGLKAIVDLLENLNDNE